tara:strand:+ start:201 stop:659 length:459 start_codon:yes stop_codon:yes gene_type:complete
MAAINMQTINGTAYIEIEVDGIPVIADNTKRFIPKGGVMKPNPRVVSIKIQKCISSIPTSSARGNNSGPSITMLGAASINAPAITKTPSITAIKKIGSDEISVKFATICCGICISDNACATGNESAIIGTIIPFTFTEESNIFGISLNDIDF